MSVTKHISIIIIWEFHVFLFQQFFFWGERLLFSSLFLKLLFWNTKIALSTEIVQGKQVAFSNHEFQSSEHLLPSLFLFNFYLVCVNMCLNSFSICIMDIRRRKIFLWVFPQYNLHSWRGTKYQAMDSRSKSLRHTVY